MAKILSEDAYCLGLLYVHLYAHKQMVLKEDLDKFQEIIEYNLKCMNSGAKDIYTTVWGDDEPSIYFASEGKNGEIYYVLYPNLDLEKAKSKYIGCLSTDILVASQKENALNSIDLEKVNGNIVRRKTIESKGCMNSMEYIVHSNERELVKKLFPNNKNNF